LKSKEIKDSDWLSFLCVMQESVLPLLTEIRKNYQKINREVDRLAFQPVSLRTLFFVQLLLEFFHRMLYCRTFPGITWNHRQGPRRPFSLPFIIPSLFERSMLTKSLPFIWFRWNNRHKKIS